MICKCIAEVSKEGYPIELDLFYARACIDMLLRSTAVAKTKVILDEGRKVAGPSPLLNFVEFLIEALIAQNFEMAKTMTLTDYAQHLKRDPQLSDKVDKVCQKAFGQGFQPPNPMQ